MHSSGLWNLEGYPVSLHLHTFWIAVALSKIWDEQHKQCATQKKFRSKLHGRCSYHLLFRNDMSWLYHMYWIYFRISPWFTPTHHQVSLWGFWHTFLDGNSICKLQVNLSSPDPRTMEGFQAEIKFTLANTEATATKSFVEERCSAACCLASGDFEMLMVQNGSNQFFVCLWFLKWLPFRNQTCQYKIHILSKHENTRQDRQWFPRSTLDIIRLWYSKKQETSPTNPEFLGGSRWPFTRFLLMPKCHGLWFDGSYGEGCSGFRTPGRTGELREPPAMTMCKAASAVAKMTLRLAKSLKSGLFHSRYWKLWSAKLHDFRANLGCLSWVATLCKTNQL